MSGAAAPLRIAERVSVACAGWGWLAGAGWLAGVAAGGLAGAGAGWLVGAGADWPAGGCVESPSGVWPPAGATSAGSAAKTARIRHVDLNPPRIAANGRRGGWRSGVQSGS